MGSAPALVGRADELDTVGQVLRAAGEGRPGAVLVSGEAGIGKSALVRAACDALEPDVVRLWGSCLPLAALTIPFAPLRSALRTWTGAAGPATVPAVPETGTWPDGLDAWLRSLSERRPVVLVVDDLQWADQSSLDTLLYLLVAPPDRLAVLATLREGEVKVGHPVRRWLADARRLPGVSELPLGRLDRIATERQLADLLGRPPHHGLIDEVLARSHGNPYWTRLLAHGLSPDARRLPEGLPADLRDAVARSWHGLGRAARDVTQLLAVAGRPTGAGTLATVAGEVGLGLEVLPQLQEGVDAGLLAVHDDESYWFVHPLTAEVLRASLLPEHRRARHAAFAAALRGGTGPDDDPDMERAVAIADHYDRAGDLPQAFRWALRAADATERAGGSTEMLRLLRRAHHLWAPSTEPDVSRHELLHRLRAAAEHAGAQEAELAAVDDLLAVADPGTEPLTVAELLVRRAQLRQLTGREFAALDGAREAVRLSAGYPDSPVHALAVAELARAEMWQGQESGVDRARRAVELARRSGSSRALAYALTAEVMAESRCGSGGRPELAQEAQLAAARAGDHLAFVHASLWWGNVAGPRASREVVDLTRRARERLSDVGAPHCYVAWLSAVEAFDLLQTGDWRSCLLRLRVAMGSAPGPMGDSTARLTAALLAGWQGRVDEAAAHLARAEELVAEQASFLPLPFDAVRAELAVATGDTGTAFSSAVAGLGRSGHPPLLVERLAPLAARALADEADSYRDRGADPAPVASQVRRLRDRFPAVGREPGPVAAAYQLQLDAMQAWYDAEVARAGRSAGALPAWRAATLACEAAGLGWDEAYAQWRVAETMVRIGSPRDELAAALRRGHELATRLGSAPLRRRVEALARGARVSLQLVPRQPEARTADAGAGAGTGATIDALPGLTPREREVLAHVVAGRTYGEIARALVISEKTVSVHISSLLRKTGAANRVDLAALVARVSSPGSR